jgi:NADH-quinone oxidoreductase subunit G
MAEQVTSPPSGPSATPPGAPADAPAAEPGITFTLDGRPATAQPGEMLISAAERAGTYIPRFCYHPRMKPVGMCRMCLVEVSSPRGATLQPSCFIAATEGMEVVTDSDKVKKAQDGVLEFLLVNHPLDCPVCDKGGECPLQDQTLAYGPGESRFVEEKRHFEKPVAISDLVLLDRERCIQCARCTRFAEEVAGEAQIDFAGRGEHVEVATFPDEPFSSYFSGNTVQICPVGALTATPYRFAARPWDLDQVESTCTTCSLGCRVAVQSSANRLTRLLGIDSEPVNHGWLCDKGRFTFESVNGDEVVAEGQFTGEARETGSLQTGRQGRLTEPMVRKDGELVPVSWSEALTAAAAGLAAARDAGGPGAVAVLGGARCTNEGAYAWAKLAKGVLGTDSVDAQLGDGLPAELVLSLPRATVEEACSAKTVVLLTGDVREELPVLFLRLRQAALEGGTALVELTPRPTSLSRYAAVSIATRPGDAPSLARALTGDDGAASSLQSHPEGPAWHPDDLVRARQLLGTQGSTVVVVLGRPSLAEHEGVVAEAARVLASALPGARFLPVLRRGNVHGALDMGLAPGILPGRVSLAAAGEWFTAGWGSVPAVRGLDATAILGSLAGDDTAEPTDDRVRALVAVGADLTGDFPDHQLATRALAGAEFVVAVTGHPSPTVDRADVVLPVAVTHERPGTTTNVEGRLSRLGQKLVAPGLAWSDWMIAAELAVALGGDLRVDSVSELWEEIERLAPAYAGITPAVLDSDAERDGVLVPFDAAARASARAPEPIDPVALPGVESVERQGAPPRVGSAELSDPPGAPLSQSSMAGSSERGDPNPTPAVPRVLSITDAGAGEGPHVPPVDSYSLRLVSTRRLYDAGSAVAGSPSLASLVPVAVARANPYDLDRLGVATGDPVRIRSARAALVLPAEADGGVPRGVVAVEFNLPAPDGSGDGDGTLQNAASALIDATAVVTDVRMESVR